jgi:pimeloyl-ACP methyl ester carboxylesterase
MSANQALAIEAIRTPEVAVRYMASYDALLHKWPIPYESINIPTSFGLTHVITCGPADAPPLVLLHGLQATALIWRPNVADLSRHFRVYAVDVIGQGGKSMSSRRLRTGQNLADWMCEWFDALGIEQAAVVGNSYGGFIAMNQALLAPQRVKQIVLINPAGVFASILPYVMTLFWELIRDTLRWRGKQPKPDFAERLGRNVQLSGEDTEWAALMSLVTFNWEVKVNSIFPRKFRDAELRAIDKPALLLMGDNDVVYDPLATLHLAKRRMPSLQAHMVPGAHHAAAMAKPEAVNALILEFLLNTR